MFDPSLTTLFLIAAAVFAVDIGVFALTGIDDEVDDGSDDMYDRQDFQAAEIVSADSILEGAVDAQAPEPETGSELTEVQPPAAVPHLVTRSDDNLFVGDDAVDEADSAETFTVYPVTSEGAPGTDISDFNPAEDSLHIQYYGRDDPETGAPLDPQLAVTYDPDSDMTHVRIFGATVATLPGDAGITEADVSLTRIS